MMRKMRMTKFFIFLISIVILPANVFTGQVPDTGQAKCYDEYGEIPCPQLGDEYYGQDAQYAGPARSYTKLGQNGIELPEFSTQADGWIMTRDNVTKLIWEIKTDDGSVHDKDNIYTWFDSNPLTNGGYAGTPGDGTDTEDFINTLNSAYYGGFEDWRMPTFKELSTLLNSAMMYPYADIDSEWFPNTLRSDYWSSTTIITYNINAWHVSFNFTEFHIRNKSAKLRVRAVRGGE
jgi:hypothetical protein